MGDHTPRRDLLAPALVGEPILSPSSEHRAAHTRTNFGPLGFFDVHQNYSVSSRCRNVMLNAGPPPMFGTISVCARAY